jgi:hypothetical protein
MTKTTALAIPAASAVTYLLDYDIPELVAEVRRLRAALGDLVWVTNILGDRICDLCGQGEDEPGRPDCSCRLLRAM